MGKKNNKHALAKTRPKNTYTASLARITPVANGRVLYALHDHLLYDQQSH